MKILENCTSNTISQVIDYYTKPLYAYAVTLCKDKMLSQDILQEVFISLFNNCSKLANDVQIKSWLYKSVHNKFIDFYRKEQSKLDFVNKQAKVLDDWQSQDDYEENLEDLSDKLNIAIENLPAKIKEIFILRKLEGLTTKEVADYTKMSPKSIERYITQAYKILKEELILD